MPRYYEPNDGVFNGHYRNGCEGERPELAANTITALTNALMDVHRPTHVRVGAETPTCTVCRGTGRSGTSGRCIMCAGAGLCPWCELVYYVQEGT